MNRVDVAIIGAGPGGGMAACELAGKGLKVLLVEKEKLPRFKACGGAMPATTSSLFSWDISHLVEREVTITRTLNNYSQPAELVRRSPIVFVNRSDFDYHLVERASRSITVRDGYAIRAVEESEDGVILRGADGDSIQATYLIAGDGALSPTARSLGLNQARSYAPAFDAEVELDAEIFAAECGRATFNYFCLPGGYGWIFPKRDLLACGIGTWSRERIPLRAALDDFLHRTFPPSAIRAVRVYGHPIPVYNGHTQIATRRVCLVGDAASLVDPILGEGIRYGLISGKTAAQVVGALLGVSTGEGDAQGEGAENLEAEGCLAYQKQIHNTNGKEFVALSKFIAPIYQKAPDYFYSKFIQSGFGYSNLSHNLAKSFPFVKL